MRLTNKLNLPQPFVDAVRNDPYSKGDADYSITGLLRPPRIAQLEKIHDDDIEEDVADRIWSLFGQVAHGILERAERTALAEKRLYAKVSGKTISGQLDRLVLIDGKLQDYKVVKVWKVKDGVPTEFEQQLNCYAWLGRQNGFAISQAELVCLLRDRNDFQASRNENYPAHDVHILGVKLWKDEETQAFIQHRIQLHESAASQLPLCSLDERWGERDVWAVMAPGRKRAVRVYATEAQALEHILAFPSEGYYLDHRPGHYGKRCCQKFCRAFTFCDQAKERRG